MTKDEISFTNKDLSEFVGGYTVDKDLTPKIKGMLESFYDTNIVVRQKVGGLKPFYVINKAGKDGSCLIVSKLLKCVSGAEFLT